MAQAELDDVRAKAIRERTSVYRQLKEQLRGEVERYRREGKERLAEIISRSLDE